MAIVPQQSMRSLGSIRTHDAASFVWYSKNVETFGGSYRCCSLSIVSDQSLLRAVMQHVLAYHINPFSLSIRALLRARGAHCLLAQPQTLCNRRHVSECNDAE